MLLRWQCTAVDSCHKSMLASAKLTLDCSRWLHSCRQKWCLTDADLCIGSEIQTVGVMLILAAWCMHWQWLMNVKTSWIEENSASAHLWIIMILTKPKQSDSINVVENTELREHGIFWREQHNTGHSVSYKGYRAMTNKLSVNDEWEPGGLASFCCAYTRCHFFRMNDRKICCPHKDDWLTSRWACS